MRPLRSLLCLALLSLGPLSACALRPHYREVLPPDVTRSPASLSEEQEVTLRVVDPATGQPIPGARVLAGENRVRFNVTSDAQGLVKVPVSRALLSENPLVEVVLPKGVSGYRLEPVK